MHCKVQSLWQFYIVLDEMSRLLCGQTTTTTTTSTTTTTTTSSTTTTTIAAAAAAASSSSNSNDNLTSVSSRNEPLALHMATYIVLW